MCPWRTRPDPKAHFPKFYCKSWQRCRFPPVRFCTCFSVKQLLAHPRPQCWTGWEADRTVWHARDTYSSVYLAVLVFSEPHQYLLFISDSKLIYAGRQWAQFLFFMKSFVLLERVRLCVLVLPPSSSWCSPRFQSSLKIHEYLSMNWVERGAQAVLVLLPECPGITKVSISPGPTSSASSHEKQKGFKRTSQWSAWGWEWIFTSLQCKRRPGSFSSKS